MTTSELLVYRFGLRFKLSVFPFHLSFHSLPQIQLPSNVELVRDRLAENLHEMWSMRKIDQGWKYGEVSKFLLQNFFKFMRFHI